MPRQKKTRKKWWRIDGLTMAVCVLAVTGGFFQEIGKDAWHASKGGLAILNQIIRSRPEPTLVRNPSYDSITYSEVSIASKPRHSVEYDNSFTDSGISHVTSMDYGGRGYDFGGGSSNADFGGDSSYADYGGNSRYFNFDGRTSFDPGRRSTFRPYGETYRSSSSDLKFFSDGRDVKSGNGSGLAPGPLKQRRSISLTSSVRVAATGIYYSDLGNDSYYSDLGRDS